jgi:hypothetical protein
MKNVGVEWGYDNVIILDQRFTISDHGQPFPRGRDQPSTNLTGSTKYILPACVDH